MGVRLAELTEFLDDYLKISDVPDSPRSFNGLQVEGSGDVNKFLVAVDASKASIEAAVSGGFDLLLVHHGLFWSGSPMITGRNFQRLQPLLSHGIAVYSSHIPLDLHPEVGNNAVLAGKLGLRDLKPFGSFDGVQIGVRGETDQGIAELNHAIEAELGFESQLLSTGPQKAGQVAIVTGAGGSFLEEASKVGVNTLVTGEASHHNYFDAEEWGINLILAGHYATETVGVQALGRKLAQKFALDWEFFDHPTGM